MDSFPLSVQSTYQDLLESHRTRAFVEFGGKPFLKTRGSRGYWYSRQRIGRRIVDRYIGPDSPDLRRRLEDQQEHVEDQRSFNRRCASMVAQLRAAGVPALDRDSGKVLNAMARAGTFRLGGTLVGTHAFRLYAAELGVRFPVAMGVTSDIDIAAFENLKLVIDDHVDPGLAQSFRQLRLVPAPGLDPKNRPTRWHMPDSGVRVDFLAPRMQSVRETVLLEPLGIHARALSFLNFLIADPVPAVALYRNGVPVMIPRPERYAVHKLIVATRRRNADAAKARKDIAQAATLIRILAEDRPDLLAVSWEDAHSRGRAWQATLSAGICHLDPESRKILLTVTEAS